MGTTPTPVLRQVGILILDDDPQQQSALRQILDAEGWRVRVAPDARSLLSELATGEWALVIANVTLTGTDGAAYLTLNELASVPAEEGARIRALFVIPETAGKNYARALEQAHLPYVIRPFHLHEFLEKVSDLLVEIKAIEAPLRQVRHEFSGLRKKKKAAGRENTMFASRDGYSYTEEELAEYESTEQEASTQRKKRQKPLTDLGRPTS
ncbi:MAG: hypothetical protein DMG33_12860 [Acidobacteria bacterium]|nr:MAG: hypothetical protein DMG33_12860 [Acidobacteriota bacterium]